MQFMLLQECYESFERATRMNRPVRYTKASTSLRGGIGLAFFPSMPSDEVCIVDVLSQHLIVRGKQTKFTYKGITVSVYPLIVPADDFGEDF